MRIALISDIHGHDTALEAVLDALARQAVDSVVCLGDVATLGPQPRQVLARLKDLGCACILGNHDAALLDPASAPQNHIPPVLVPTLAWCAGQLTRGERDFVQSFRSAIEVPLGEGVTLLCFHGSPRAATDQILATTPDETLAGLLAGSTAAILAGGHTHIQMLRQHAGRPVLNPGSVGSVFLVPPGPETFPTLSPWAEYGILDWASGTMRFEFHRVPFDTRAFAEVVAKSDIPIQRWWLQQYRAVEQG
jgi:putative phosphoesterase